MDRLPCCRAGQGAHNGSRHGQLDDRSCCKADCCLERLHTLHALSIAAALRCMWRRTRRQRADILLSKCKLTTPGVLLITGLKHRASTKMSLRLFPSGQATADWKATGAAGLDVSHLAAALGSAMPYVAAPGPTSIDTSTELRGRPLHSNCSVRKVLLDLCESFHMLYVHAKVACRWMQACNKASCKLAPAKAGCHMCMQGAGVRLEQAQRRTARSGRHRGQAQGRHGWHEPPAKRAQAHACGEGAKWPKQELATGP